MTPPMDRNQSSSRRRVPRSDLKKRRPPVACIPCYSRKVKCGREVPTCRRCIAGGLGHACSYRNNSFQETCQTVTPNQDEAIPPAPSFGDENVQSNIPNNEAQPHIGEATGPAQTISSRGMLHFKGRAASTRFYGFSYHLNLYQQFADLPSYIVQVKAQHPLINQLRDEIFSVATKKPGYLQNPKGMFNAQHFLDLLPQKNIADTLTEAYLDTLELTNRVLHIPSFMYEYNRHWGAPTETKAAVLTQMCLVMAAASTLCPDTMALISCPHPIEMAKTWVEAAEAWLTWQFTTPPESLQALQIHCLLLIAKRANYIQEAACWSSTGNLVRWVMAAGYHREVGPDAHVSEFHQELRRRLWTTIVELDLQAAIERGMPPSIKQDDFNIRMPANENDEGITLASKNAPMSQPISNWTTSSFQIVLHRSYHIRSDICAWINGCQSHEGFDRISSLVDKLTVALSELPTWDKSYDGTLRKSTLMYLETTLKIILNQYLLLLYIPSAIQTSPTGPKAICQRGRLDASVTILSHYRTMTQKQLVTETSCRIGLHLAAMNLCHELYLSARDTATDGIITVMPELAQPLLLLVEHAWRLVEKRVTSTLEGLSEYYVLSMVIGLVKSQYTPSSSAAWAKEVGESVVQVGRLLHTAITANSSTRNINELGHSEGEDRGIESLSVLMPDDLDFLLHDFDFGSSLDQTASDATHIPLFS